MTKIIDQGNYIDLQDQDTLKTRGILKEGIVSMEERLDALTLTLKPLEIIQLTLSDTIGEGDETFTSAEEIRTYLLGLINV